MCVCFRGKILDFSGLLGREREDAVLLACCCPRSERRRKGPSLEGLSLPKCGPARQGQRFETAGDQGNDDVMRNLKYMVIDMHQWSANCPRPAARAERRQRQQQQRQHCDKPYFLNQHLFREPYRLLLEKQPAAFYLLRASADRSNIQRLEEISLWGQIKAFQIWGTSLPEFLLLQIAWADRWKALCYCLKQSLAFWGWSQLCIRQWVYVWLHWQFALVVCF